MKKFLVLLLSLLLMLSCFSLAAAEGSSQTPEPRHYTSGNWEYIYLDDDSVEIAKCLVDAEEITIPDTLDGLKVLSIGRYAFSSCKSLTAVAIPEGVMNITDFAFSHCEALTTVTIPDSLENIGINPFLECGSLVDIIISPDHPYLETMDGVLLSKPDKRLVCYLRGITSESHVIPNGVQMIGEYAYFGCKSLKSIVIPDSVTDIGVKAFCSCYNMSSITIPDSVVTIGEKAFTGCSSLAQVTIPDSVASLGDQAFSECMMTSITIPDSVTSIGANPFSNCLMLTGIIISPDHPYLETIDGVLFSKPDKRLICYPRKFSAESYVIPDGVRMIGDYAFCYCKSLTTVTIPDSVTSIGEWAFFMCSSLTSVTIPDSVTSIGEKAFNKCESLTVAVSRNSYAMQYCGNNGINYVYQDANE